MMVVLRYKYYLRYIWPRSIRGAVLESVITISTIRDIRTNGYLPGLPRGGVLALILLILRPRLAGLED
jgi:hypothetical protein